VFVVFKPELPGDFDDFKQQVSAMIDRIEATPRQLGIGETRIPAQRALRSRERALREGIEVYRLTYDALAGLQAWSAAISQ
jgi:LDH2 family malate/lactate/ureidoglycolate dehydrogenase